MKDIILTFICVIVLFTCGCTKVSHNANLVGVGKVFKVGAGDYGITYVNGLIGIQAVRENSEAVVETNDGDSFANPASAVKGIRAIRFRTGPQVTGYLVDLSKKNAEAATAYVNNMPELNKGTWDAKQDKPIDTKLSSEKGADGSSSVTIGWEKVKEVAKSTLEKLKGNKTGETITGDGDYNGLWQDASIEHQAALTSELLAISDNVTLIQEDGETIRDTLVHYAGRLAQLKAKGKSESKRILLDRCTVKDGKVTFLRYRLTDIQSGESRDEVCPNCYGLED